VYAIPVKDPCDGCHSVKEAAIADALRRIGLCEAAAEILTPLTERLRAALSHLQQVPADLGEAYELVYAFGLLVVLMLFRPNGVFLGRSATAVRA